MLVGNPSKRHSAGKANQGGNASSHHHQDSASQHKKSNSASGPDKPNGPGRGSTRLSRAHSTSSPITDDSERKGTTPSLTGNKEKKPSGLHTCGCPTSEEDQMRNMRAYAFAQELRDEQGRPDAGFSLFLNGYWPKVPGRPWIFDGVQAPNVENSGVRNDDD